MGIIERVRRHFDQDGEIADEEEIHPSSNINETAALIGEAVAEVIPQSVIANGSVFEIDVLITNGDEVTDLHLKMRVDGGLCVQMMEYPIDAES